MKTAVVLFNLGGPDSLNAVKPFLFNLFNDPAIIPWPKIPRWCLAKLISGFREKKAIEIYRKIGGKSPLYENTLAQAVALEGELGGGVRIFVAMRYWHPFIPDVVRDVIDYSPDKIVLLPLYPQFSTTTTGSSFSGWHKQAALQGLTVKTKEVTCYPAEDGFLKAYAGLVEPFYVEAQKFGIPRILFSAHGLPQKVIDAGDPYQSQVEKTATGILENFPFKSCDFRICYQSRVGPAKWLTPTIGDEIKAAAHDGVPLVIVPLSFVSEHSETLVELDIEYREMAENLGVSYFGRVPTVGCQKLFIEGLAKLVRSAIAE